MKNLSRTWSIWQSGGGIMIYSHDYTCSSGRVYSLHTNGESVVNVDIPTEEYLAITDYEEQEMHHLDSNYQLTETREATYNTVAHWLCPYTGQELADILEKDIWSIFNLTM